MMAYHGTNLKKAEKIQETGFKCKKNAAHWLGNGIYFYLDEELAAWWAKTPKREYGSSVVHPVVIEADIAADDGNTIDTRILEHYNQLGRWFEKFYEQIESLGESVTKEMHSDQLRCVFFDWLHANTSVDVVVAAFPKKDAGYMTKSPKQSFYLPYCECQMCVFENDLIEIMRTIHLERE